MSDTYHSTKGQGYEYWSIRFGNGGMPSPSSEFKRRTNRAERRRTNHIVRINPEAVEGWGSMVPNPAREF